jgi:glycosyltransferase involved in cell wall biosynthesis
MPRVSVGLPVFNGQNYLSEAIDSVRVQSYVDWELVISDNGSTDQTSAICEAYAQLDSRIKIHRSSVNRGAAWNFNRVVELSQGEYFRWLSHDDVLAPTAIERCVEVLDQERDVVLCATSTGAIDESGCRIFDDATQRSDLRFQGLNSLQEERRIARSADSRPACRYQGILLDSLRCYEIYGLLRRDLLLRTQLHPSYCGGEKVLLAELALRGRFHEIREPLFYARWHDARFTANSSAREQREHMSPGAVRHFALPHQYRATLGYLQLLGLSGLTLNQRIGCFWVWCQFVLQVGKWYAIVKNTVLGRATSARLQEGAFRGDKLAVSPSQPCVVTRPRAHAPKEIAR